MKNIKDIKERLIAKQDDDFELDDIDLEVDNELIDYRMENVTSSIYKDVVNIYYANKLNPERIAELLEFGYTIVPNMDNHNSTVIYDFTYFRNKKYGISPR